MLLTGNDPSFLCDFKKSLAKKSSLKDLGPPSHFLGVEIIPTASGLFLTQHHYIRDLLQRANMGDSKPVSTPMATSFSSSTVPDSTICDSSLSRSILGSLHYLSITCLDVAFPVNKLAQHMQSPTTTHMQALKRILHYLKSTISHGLHLTKSSNLALTAFCDADWGGDTQDRKSLVPTWSILVRMPSLGHVRSNPPLQDPPPRLNIGQLPPLLLNCSGSSNYFKNLVYRLSTPTTLGAPIYVLIWSSIPG